MDNTEVKITFQNKVTGFSGKTGLMAYEEKLKSVKKLIENMPKNLNFGGNVDKKLETTNKLLINLNKNMSSFKRNTTSALGNVSKDVTQINKKTQKLNKSNVELGENVKTAFSIQALKQFGMELERLVTSATKFIRKSAEYTENLNLLSVAFRQEGVEIEKTTNEAMKFVNTLSEMYGLDESKLIRTTGLFKQMANSLGITNEAGTKLSQTLTRLSIDAASLFNAEEIEDAARVFQSALASQTKPIRGFTGADITEQTLQVTLDTYGIDEAISSLSYAEKRLVIVASLVDQLDEAIGDFGRTIESPANQMKVFTEQVHRLARAIGNVLMPIFYKVLPYINAFMMVLVELTNYLASFIGQLFNYDFENYNPFAGIDDSITDLEEDMIGANETAEKLKNGLRGFDKLNVITTPKSGKDGSGAGSGVGGEYYDLLNQAVEKYNKKLKATEMLATKIRDNILEWLGFTVKTDKETGKLKIKFEKITAGTVLGALAVGGTIYSGVSKIVKFFQKIGFLKFDGLTKLFSLFKEGKIVTNVSKFSSSFSALASSLGMSTGAFGIVVAGIAAIVAALVHAYTTSDEFKNKIDTAFKSVANLFKDLYDIVTGLSKEIWDTIEPIWDEIWKFIKLAVEYAYDTVILNFSLIADVISGVCKIISDLIHGDFDKAFDDLIEMVENLFKDWDDYFGKIKKLFGKFIDNLIESIVDFVPKAIEKFNELVQWLEKAPEKFGYWIGEAIITLTKKITETDWLAEGEKIVNGIVNGLEKMPSKIIKWVTDTYENLKTKISEKEVDWVELGTNILKYIYIGLNPLRHAWFKVGEGILKSISDEIKGFKFPTIKLDVTYETNVGSVKTAIYKALGLKGFPKLNFGVYAQGGLPPVGQLFVANEKGPELVGQIGGQSFVANQNQMMELLDKKIGNANNGISNATFVIQVGSKEIARTVLNDLQSMAKSNGKPITIS